MTVPTLVDQNTYTATGSNSVYAYTYRILQDADLLVTLVNLDGSTTTLVLTTDYTVTGALSYSGGTVVLVAGNLGAGIGITITRAPAAVQDTSLQSQGAYDAKVVETMADLLTMLAQWQQNQLDRALVVPPGVTPVALPNPLALALLQWNSLGTGLQNIAISDLGTLLAAGNYVVDRPAFTAGVTTALTLTQAPGTVNNTAVFFDGVYQQKPTYSVSGVTLTLTSAVPLGVLSVEVVQAGVLPINTPADNSVATATIQNLAVTGPKIALLAVGSANIADHAVTPTQMNAAYLSASPQYGKNGIINGSAIIANGTDYAASVSGTYGYGKSELCKGALTGGTSVAGTLTQTTASSAGVTGCAFRWNAVTLVGTSCTVKYRFYIEAKDALRYKNGTATFSARVYHNTGSPINYTITVSKANAADNFGAITTIQAGSAQSVASATDTAIYLRAISMGDCSNGIQIDIVAASGAVAAKLFDLTDCQLEPGSAETAIEIRPLALEERDVARLFENFSYTSANPIAPAQCITTSSVQALFSYQKKRAIPTVTIVATQHLQVTHADGTVEDVTSTGVVANLGLSSAFFTLAVAGTPLVAGNGSLVRCGSGLTQSITVDARF